MKKCLLILFVFSSLAQAAEDVHSLSSDAWAVPKDGDALRNMRVLRTVMAKLQQSMHSQLLIQYPGGDEGSLWAVELRAWLVSLGLASNRIQLQPGSGDSKALLLTVVTPDSGDGTMGLDTHAAPHSEAMTRVFPGGSELTL